MNFASSRRWQTLLLLQSRQPEYNSALNTAPLLRSRSDPTLSQRNCTNCSVRKNSKLPAITLKRPQEHRSYLSFTIVLRSAAQLFHSRLIGSRLQYSMPWALSLKVHFSPSTLHPSAHSLRGRFSWFSTSNTTPFTAAAQASPTTSITHNIAKHHLKIAQHPEHHQKSSRQPHQFPTHPHPRAPLRAPERIRLPRVL